jgi:hypothetical protein
MPLLKDALREKLAQVLAKGKLADWGNAAQMKA